MDCTILDKISFLPNQPGVYQFFDKKGKIIYIGKAKNLKKRVSSYFVNRQDSPKTSVLVSKICDIKYILVENENDALLLESNLIKKYLPRYNLMLKYGTTYPYLAITGEEFPRVFKTRKIIPGAEMFGPYSLVGTLNDMLELIRDIYPIRSCKLGLTSDSIKENKYKVCLEYHIKNCKGVCCGLQSKEEYNQMIDDVRNIAKGNSHIIEDFLLNNIKQLSSELKFEEAYELKEKYDAVKSFRQKTVITTLKYSDMDVFSCISDDQYVYINMLRVANGSIIQSDNIEYKKCIEEVESEVFSMGIIELRDKYKSKNKQVIVPFVPDFKIEGVEFIVPQRDYKKRLLDLSRKNVLQYKRDRYTQKEKLNASQQRYSLISNLKNMLNLPTLPHVIELFDNSHISGQNAVSVCVVFKDAKPQKSKYRKYILNEDNNGDDYISMHEVVTRRYLKIIEERSSLPDLIIVDGGKGHISTVKNALSKININIPVAGLAKNDKHQTNEIIFEGNVVGLKPNDDVFVFLTKMQNEVHRFAITFHRHKRIKKQVSSQLDDIDNIGEKTKQALLTHFKSVERIKNAPIEEIEEIIGKKRAKILSLKLR